MADVSRAGLWQSLPLGLTTTPCERSICTSDSTRNSWASRTALSRRRICTKRYATRRAKSPAKSHSRTLSRLNLPDRRSSLPLLPATDVAPTGFATNQGRLPESISAVSKAGRRFALWRGPGTGRCAIQQRHRSRCWRLRTCRANGRDARAAWQHVLGRVVTLCPSPRSAPVG